MSKTVMRVMMIGLVAMLGAKAEAHYYVVAGKAKYCSVCVDAELAEHEEHSVNPTTLTEVPALHSEKVEFCVTTKSIDILCPSNARKKKCGSGSSAGCPTANSSRCYYRTGYRF